MPTLVRADTGTSGMSPPYSSTMTPGFGQLGLHAVRVGVGLVDLVERDDDRHLRRLGVVDRFERLGHHAVVGGHHDHRDVGDPRAARAHRGERLVARGVEEDDAAVVLDDLARADVLRDAAPLAGRHVGGPDRVEQARLAVVDVTHDRDDRRAWLQVGRIVRLEQDFLRRFGRRRFTVRVLGGPDHADPGLRRLGHFIAELAGHQRRGVAVDQLVDAREDPALDQLADHVRGVHVEQRREVLDGDRRGQLDRATLARVGNLDRRRRDGGVSPRCGLRGPRRPRVPLLLLANGLSFVSYIYRRTRPSARAARWVAGRRPQRLRRPVAGS